MLHAQAHHELDLGALAERPPARPLARTDVHDPPAGRHQPGARPLPRHELPWRCEIRTSCEAGLGEPALELLALDVRGGRSGELVEDNAVVLAEAEVGHARHVLVQRERPPGTRVLERSVHALRDAVERDGERPGDGAQRGARQLRREPAEGLDGVPHEAVVLEAVEPDRDRPPGPQIREERAKAFVRVGEMVEDADRVDEVEASTLGRIAEREPQEVALHDMDVAERRKVRPRGLDGAAQVHGDDLPGTEAGGEVRVPSGAAAGVQDALAREEGAVDGV